MGEVWVDEAPAHPAARFLASAECDACGAVEERCWSDSWTGKSLCHGCLSPVIDRLANSPASEGDNLVAELRREGIIE